MVSIGGGSSKSERSTSETWATGSSIKAGRDIAITARGGNDRVGDLTIIGSDITAGRDILLAARDDILIGAAREESSITGSNKSSGGSIGASIGSEGATYTLSGNVGRGREQGSVSAGAGGGGSASLDQTKIDHEFRSVSEQAGIYAGEGGFDITVGGNTDLTGAVIASDAEADQNRLDTGTLTWSDLQNESKTSGSSIGGTIGYGADPNSPRDASMITGIDIAPGVRDKETGTTHSAIAEGTITIRDEENQRQDVASLSRDTDTANVGALQDTFDRRKIEEQMEDARKKQEAAQKAEREGNHELAAQLRDEAAAIESLWGDTGAARLAGHALIGALAADTAGGSALAGAGGAITGPLIADLLADELKDLPQEVRDALITAAATAAGAAVGGADGAAMANSEVKNNFLTGSQIEEILKDLAEGNITEQEATERMGELSKQNIEQFDACLQSQDAACLSAMAQQIMEGSPELYKQLGMDINDFGVSNTYKLIAENALEFIDNCTKGGGWMQCSMEQLAAQTALYGALTAIGASQLSTKQKAAEAEKKAAEKIEQVAENTLGSKAKDLVGKDFEKYLHKELGGKESFRASNPGGGVIREFDGAYGPNNSIWYEAKSGGYWEKMTEQGYRKFQSDIGARAQIAHNNGATYELHSNTPIPPYVKDWLTSKGIPFKEHFN